jgi:hypothetical protein
MQQRSYLEDNWGNQVRRVSSVQESVKRVLECQAEKFPLLKSVTRKHLMKTLQVGENFTHIVL